MRRDPAVRAAWRERGEFLPIRLERTTLRELRASDASSLVPLLDDPEVRRFLPGAPMTPGDFAHYAAWVERQRRGGRHVCVAITVGDRAIGIIQAWPLEPSAQTVEWGFALGREYWGLGLFQESARAFVSFAAQHLGVERIEARTAMSNIRGIRALQRLGAGPEGRLRRCFKLDGARVDCLLWSILAAEWPAAIYVPSESPHTTLRLSHDLPVPSSRDGILIA
jgi:RimJ/RimL family protein N-acetyltransferase